MLPLLVGVDVCLVLKFFRADITIKALFIDTMNGGQVLVQYGASRKSLVADLAHVYTSLVCFWPVSDPRSLHFVTHTHWLTSVNTPNMSVQDVGR